MTPASVELVPLEADPDVQQAKTDTSALLEAAQALEIRTEQQDREAKELLAQVKKGRKRVEEMRKRWTGPLNESLKRINADFRTISEPLEEAEKALRAKVAGFYQRQQEKAERAQQRALERALKKGTAPKPTAVAQPKRVTRTDEGSVSFREVWCFEIVDASQVPDEYKVIDEAKLGKVVRAGLRSIPGVRIFAEQRAVVR